MIGPSVALYDYLDAQVAVVVSVSWGGRTWRVSQHALTGDVDIDVGLVEVPDLTDEISLAAGGDLGTSVSAGLVLPAVSVAEHIAAGLDLMDLVAEVAWVWHRSGTLLHPWSAREVRAQGHAVEPVWGDPAQPAGFLAFTIEDSPYRTPRPLCSWRWAVTEDTWPDSPEIGERYPLPLGSPDAGAAGGGPPAPVIQQSGVPENTVALVSVGWCRASKVTVIDSAGGSDTLDIAYVADGLGQYCAIVTLTGSALDVSDGTTYTTAWDQGPALAPMGGTGPLHLAAYLLALGGADIDLPEWVRLAALLRLTMGGYVDDPESQAWEVARDLLTGMPVTMRRSRDGWAPVLLDPHLAASTVAETWHADGPWRRVSSWSAVGDGPVGRVEVNSETTELRAGAGQAYDAPLPHAWIRHLPRLSEDAQRVVWSWDPSTDWRVLSWAARIGALGWEASAWQVPPQWARQSAGTWVYLEADGRHALIQRRTLSGGVWDYTLVRPRGR